MYTEEGGYKKLIQALKHDSEYDYERIREIAQSPEVSKTPIIRSNFSDCQKVQRKNIQRLNKELKMLEKEWDQQEQA